MTRLGVLLLPLALVAAGCSPEPPAELFQKLNYDEALAKAKAENKAVMIDFYADWCGPCHKLEAETFSDAKVRQFLGARTIAIRVNIDDHPPLAQRHNVTSIPCVVFLNGEGREVGRMVGFQPAQPFLAKAREIVQ
jgi:thiol:disulfide interchange protein